MTDEHHRRAADEEAFKYNIVSAQAEIKTKVELLHDMVRVQLEEHKKRLEKLETTVWGYQSDRPGLAEQNRNLIKDIAKIFGYISIAGFVLYKIISPIYDTWITHWIPQKIAQAETNTPIVKSKIIRKTVTTKDTHG